MSIEAPQKTPGQSAGLNAGVHFLRYGLPVFVVMAAIFAVSQMSADAVNDAPSSGLLTAVFGRFTDEAAHFTEYFVLSGLILRWILAERVPRGTPRTDIALVRSSVGKAVAFAVLYGISDEAHQWFIDGRSVELLDLFVDGIGASSGAAIYLSVYQVWRVRVSRTRRVGGFVGSPGKDAGALTGQPPNTTVSRGHHGE